MIKSIINKYRDAIKDPERKFSERVFLILTVLSEVTLLAAFVGDIITGEDIKELILLVAVIIIVPTFSTFCLYIDRLNVAISFIAVGIVFIVVPGIFFFGGGLDGGGFIWVIFSFLYIGLVVSGRMRKVFFVMLFLVTLICYLVAYYFPETVTVHSKSVNYVDTFLSVILVGVLCFLMTWFQNRLFMEENLRAKKEAERAEELTRAQNRFFSSMSHEIRTPINSILGLNELILRDQDASDDVIKESQGIRGAGKLLLALINDILDFSKMEAGSMDIVPVDYNVGDLMSEIVNMIYIKAQDKGLRFDVGIDPKVPRVLYGDEVRIKQIMINLLNNAVKYTAEGSISLNIDSERIDEKTAMLTIAVSDTGMGIKKEALPDLFSAFKRVDEEKNRNIEGTGLGLSIVKQLIELMDGEVSVSSVYGEGSTFTVNVKQGISDPTEIGELNVHSQKILKRSKYESSFRAPEARILIVDDNEMNLEVEKKLLTATEMDIDTALSGREALDMTLNNRYDVIFMDHLMPQMDGIECLQALRMQSSGLNRSTPVVVLTANAGSDNRDLYNRAGFDGYLIKPVSGGALEDMLMKHISQDKLILNTAMAKMHEDINTTAGYARKVPVTITSTSMSDLPDALIKKLKLPILPFHIITDEGVFKDSVQMDANELIRYISTGKNAASSPPSVKDYTDFFAKALRHSHHLIHIALTTSMSKDYERAVEAAKSFDNVTVINSEVLSSATGILILIAQKLVQQNYSVEEIVAELETVKKRLRCSFIIDTTSYMAARGYVSANVNAISKALNLHPSLKFKDDKLGLGRIRLGSTKRAYKKYIHEAIPVDIIPDSDVVFITYADVPMDTLMWIKEEISKIAYFENVIFQPASAAISSNCGPGSVGILYFVKSNKSYNLGSFFDTEEDKNVAFLEDTEDVSDEDVNATDNAAGRAVDNAKAAYEVSAYEPIDEVREGKWYDGLDFIDTDLAIKNSGSEEAFKSVLKIFYDSIPTKSSELNKFYLSEDWPNYTIKIHALKSSAKLIGAMELSDKALALEMAGKEEKIDFIRENHDAFMLDYKHYGDLLKNVFGEGETEDDTDKPVADVLLIESVYEALHEAADDMDCDAMEEVIKEIEGYAIPKDHREKIAALREKIANYDYNGVLEVLDKA